MLDYKYSVSSLIKFQDFFEGKISVQDYGAQLAAHLIDLEKGQTVLDACSAPGGKACHMLELSPIQLLAVESDEKRIIRIQENINRQGLTAKIKNEKIGNKNEWWDKKNFDRILLDVPCSASGIVRRHVDIKWLRRINDFEKFWRYAVRFIKIYMANAKKERKIVICNMFNIS